jgi:GntR family transcriptional regulator / MocR family aminotransferase
MRAAITLDLTSDVPMHRQLSEAWRQGVLQGRFRSGERVPSTRELAHSLGVSRSTVTAAYEQLIAEGYLVTARGAGTFVCRELPEMLLPQRPTPKRARPAAAPVRWSRWATAVQREHHTARPSHEQAPGMTSFAKWGPDPSHFPAALWRRLILRHWREPKPGLLDYADARGYEPLRQEIAAYVVRLRAARCTPEQVLIVNGSQQALDLSARLLLERGAEVAFEDPGYLGTRRTFDAYGARLRGARIDQEGLVVSDLGSRARLVYVTPSHQFPTGVSMSLTRRLELLAWARRQSAVIVEDDYDSEYRYSGPPLPCLQGLSEDVPVIYCGTFSKVMFPGLRIGYLIVPQPMLQTFVRAKWISDRHTALIEQAALTDFLREGHLERHVRRMRRIYGRRREVLCSALSRHFGERVSVHGECAGMQLLVRFEDRRMRQWAIDASVLLPATDGYYLRPRRHTDYSEFLLGFAAMPEAVIEQAVRRLAAAVPGAARR